MRGFNNKPLLEKDPKDIHPMRWHILVKIILPEYESSGLAVPDTVGKDKDDTSATIGDIISMGDMVEDSEAAEGVLREGVRIIFDESVSIDDPRRAFDWEGDRYVLVDVQTVLGIVQEIPDHFGADEDQPKRYAVAMLRDLVMVKPEEKKEVVRKSGIIVPETVHESLRGRVWAVGPGAFSSDGGRLPMSFRANDFVWCPKYQNTEVKICNTKYLIIPQDHILAVEKKQEAVA